MDAELQFISIHLACFTSVFVPSCNLAPRAVVSQPSPSPVLPLKMSLNFFFFSVWFSRYEQPGTVENRRSWTSCLAVRDSSNSVMKDSLKVNNILAHFISNMADWKWPEACLKDRTTVLMSLRVACSFCSLCRPQVFLSFIVCTLQRTNAGQSRWNSTRTPESNQCFLGMYWLSVDVLTQ